jgi:hypothetical protein
MAVTVQQPHALKAVELLQRRYLSVVGNPEKLKVRVLKTPKGKQLAVMLTNQELTVMTEPVYSAVLPIAKYHKRRYAEDEARNSNLNFHGSRLGKPDAADCWVFPGQPEFDVFIDWYLTLSGDGL